MLFNRRLPSLIQTAYYYDSIGGFLYGIFYGLSLSLIPIVARKIGSSNLQMGFLTTAPFIGALFAFFWAHYSSEKRKMPFLILVKGIGRGALFLMLFSFQPWMFIFTVFLFYFFEFAGSPAYGGIVQDIYPKEHRGKAMGYVQAEMLLAIILFSYIAGYLLFLGERSYTYIFSLGAIFGLLSLAFFQRIKVESDKRLEKRKRQFPLIRVREIFQKDRRYLRFSSIFFLFGFANLLPLALYPIFLVDNLKISTMIAGKLVALSSLFWLISTFFWAEHIDRKDPLKTLCILFLFASFTPFLYFLATNIWFAASAAVCVGIVSGGLWLAWVNYITKIALPRDVQVYWGIQFSLMGIRGIIAPFIGIGLMHLLGIKGVFLISSSLIFLSFLLMSYFFSKNKQIVVRSG
jgi:DHA1 family multidrug resistance protein-like MFS transporter